MPIAKTVVISCAGIGSRLGLGQTKSLINMHDIPLIEWQLKLFREIEDVRIVVGYEADFLIEVVLKIRKDVIFVYNHDYFNTKTLSSLYLGSRNASEYVLAIDGDIIIHPEDMEKCLAHDGEFIGISEILSDEPVKTCMNQSGQVISFSREKGEYEWIGPACIRSDRLINNPDFHVYQAIEPHLPINGLVVRAIDIDTAHDYKVALQLLEEWNIV